MASAPFAPRDAAKPGSEATSNAPAGAARLTPMMARTASALKMTNEPGDPAVHRRQQRVEHEPHTDEADDVDHIGHEAELDQAGRRPNVVGRRARVARDQGPPRTTSWLKPPATARTR